MRCAIWCSLHNFKNVKNTHGRVLFLTTPSIFFTFFKLYNGSKSRNAPHQCIYLFVNQFICSFIHSFNCLFIVASQFSCIVLFSIVFTSCPVGVYQSFLSDFIRLPVLPVFQSFLPVSTRLPVVSTCFC